MKLSEFSKKFLKAYSKARNTDDDLMISFVNDPEELGGLGPMGVITHVKIPYEYGTPGVPNVLGFVCDKEYDMTESNGMTSDTFANWLESSASKKYLNAKIYFYKDFKLSMSEYNDTSYGTYYPEKIIIDSQTKQIIVKCTRNKN